MKLMFCLLSLTMLAALVRADIEERPARPSGPARVGAGRDFPARPLGRDGMVDHLYTPEAVRRAGDQLELTPEQQQAIRAEQEKSQEKFRTLHEKVRAEAEALGKLLQVDNVDEVASLAQLDKVMAAENEVKRAQLALMIRVKNILTPAQQAKLKELRRQWTPPGTVERRPDRPERPPPPRE